MAHMLLCELQYCHFEYIMRLFLDIVSSKYHMASHYTTWYFPYVFQKARATTRQRNSISSLHGRHMYVHRRDWLFNRFFSLTTKYISKVHITVNFGWETADDWWILSRSTNILEGISMSDRLHDNGHFRHFWVQRWFGSCSISWPTWW